jgi:phosphoribosylformylglycinamidine cyclo-ligase
LPEDDKPQGVDYRWAGVDTRAADEAVRLIKEKVGATLRPEVLAGIGGFSSLFELDLSRFENPVLACGTDGVGRFSSRTTSPPGRSCRRGSPR